jgi:hypothetical protein
VIQLSKLSTHIDLQNEPIFIPLFKRESTQKKFLKFTIFAIEPIINFLKIVSLLREGIKRKFFASK